MTIVTALQGMMTVTGMTTGTGMMIGIGRGEMTEGADVIAETTRTDLPGDTTKTGTVVGARMNSAADGHPVVTTIVRMVVMNGEAGSARRNRARNVVHRPQKDVFCCLSENVRRLDGMSMHRVTSSILPCRLSRQVSLDCRWSKCASNDLREGLFNLPGANRAQVPPILAAPGLPPPMPVNTFGMGMGLVNNPNLSRQSRRLYIGNITPDINEQNLADFFNSKMKEMNIGSASQGDPVLAVQCNYEKSYAFVEVRYTRFTLREENFHDASLLFSVPQCRGCDRGNGVRWNHFP